MSFISNRSYKQATPGFTIVELLIVVVVIAILAAITIVSYNGITNRANASATVTLATEFQKKTDLFAIDGPTGSYPRALTDITGGANILSYTALNPSQATDTNSSWYISPGSIIVSPVAPTSTNGKNTIMYQVCGNNGTSTAPTTIAQITSVTGGIITYYDFQNKTIVPISVGTSTTGGNPNTVCIATTS